MKLPVFLVYTEMTRASIQMRPSEDLHVSIGVQIGISPSDLAIKVVDRAMGHKVPVSTWQGIQKVIVTMSDPAVLVSVPYCGKKGIIEELELSVENLQQLAKSQAICLHNALLQIQGLKHEVEQYRTLLQERTGLASMDQFVLVDNTTEQEPTDQLCTFTPYRED